MSLRHHSGLASLRTRLGPTLLFCASVGAALWTWQGMQHGSRLVGFADGRNHVVAPLEVARVDSVAVDVGQEVRAGQLIATLDAAGLEREIEVLRAERARAEALIAAARVEASRDEGTDRRELDAEVAAVERRLATARGELDAARAELSAQEGERRRVNRLIEQGLTGRDALADLDATVARLRAQSQAARRQADLHEGQLSEARAHLGGAGSRVEVLTAPLERELDVIDSRLRAVEDRRAARVLRAPADGRVSSVHLHAGAVTGPERPVVTLVASAGGRVIACVAESMALEVHVGDRATVWRRGNSADALGGRVVGLGPIVEEVPTRCRPNLRDRVWGRDVVVLLDEPTALVPGQAVDVRLEGYAAPVSGARADAPSVDPLTPQLIVVPPELKARTRLEPSAAVWVPKLARFVVSSDDTGLGGKDEHHPWLFTMTADGRFDPQPLAVSGVGGLNDVEALAPAPGGALYILSSQGKSAKGKRSKLRRQFLRAVPAGAGYRVQGKVLLVDLLEALTPGELSRLGLEETETLEIEGMTADGDGLLLGLKSPLAKDGGAIIWRLRDPSALFDGAGIEAAGLELAHRAPLRLPMGERVELAQLSELLRLPDGNLVIAGTSGESGGLWLLEPGASARPRLVHTFEGLRPEGIALSPTAGRLVVVFDQGDQPPYWTELPWPTP